MARLGDLIELTVGYPFKSSQFSADDEDVRLLRSDNIAQGRLRWDGVKRIPRSLATGVDRYWLKEGDVVLAMDRPWIEAGLKYAVVNAEDTPSLLVQRVSRLRAKDDLDQRFLGYLIGSRQFTQHVLAVQTGSTVPHISGKQIADFNFELPRIEEQRRIAEILGSLDARRASNQKARNLLRSLGLAKLNLRLQQDSVTRRLGDLTTSISRGITPKYDSEDGSAPLVLNQKCIRDGWVTTRQARRMVHKSVGSEKQVSSGDILVNSTGVGTLGRVGRWISGETFADSHVTIVKPDEAQVGPTVLAYIMLGRQSAIESMATGSTGQTELSPSRLANLMIEVPATEEMAVLETELAAYEQQVESLLRQEENLGALRDSLLPELLAGRVDFSKATWTTAEAVA